MITKEDYQKAYDWVSEQWGAKVADIAVGMDGVPMSMKDFLFHCTACGGNWGGMLLTGIQELYPAVWDAIPDDMGIYAWSVICNTLILLNVDTSE